MRKKSTHDIRASSTPVYGESTLRAKLPGTIRPMATPWYTKAKAVLKAKRITYQEVADKLGVEKSTVGHWMVGRNNPTFDQVREIARMIETSLSELVGEDPYFLTDENERKLIDTLRNLSPEEKQEALRLLSAYLQVRSGKQG